MKIFVPLSLLLVAGLFSGCASKQTKPSASADKTPPAIVTPDASLAAKVVSYNSAGRFVVLSFPVGQMPKVDQGFFLYRDGLKIGEIKITGPQNDSYIVADLVTGDAQVGDEVRDQ
jgi:hypothetical protein